MHQSSHLHDAVAGARYRLIAEALLADLYQLEILVLQPQMSGEADTVVYKREVTEAAARLATFFGMASPRGVLELRRSDFQLTAADVAEMKQLKAAMEPMLADDCGPMHELLRYRLLMLRVRQLAK